MESLLAPSLLFLLTAAAPSGDAPPGLSPLLHQLARAKEPAKLLSARGVHLRRGRLPVIVESSDPEVRTAMKQLGLRADAAVKGRTRVLLPLGELRTLTALARLPGVLRVREPFMPTAAAVTSESVALTGAIRAQLPNGPRVKVAVIDLGFVGLAAAVAAGELPADTVSRDFTGTGVEADTPHGTGVAEHLVDMAPSVELHCLKVGDEIDLAAAAAYLRENGIRVANHSVGWVLSGYYDDTGPISDVVNRSHDQDGVFWSVAAGNAARRHWRGTAADADADGLLELAPGKESMVVGPSSATAVLFLNWNQYGRSVTDLDLYVRDRRGAVVASSEAPQTGDEPPSEWIGFNYTAELAPYTVEIRHFAGPLDGVDVTLFTFNNDLEVFTPASSMMDPATAHGAFAVGAIDQRAWGWGSPSIERFSSQGPTTDGRAKPQLAAPDGTASSTYGARSFGTSFSAPTVAGAAALLFAQDPTRTAEEVEDLLAGAAEDVGAAGADPVFGAGKLRVPSGPAGSSLFGWATPSATNSSDPAAVEVGVEIAASVRGTIDAVRFWRASAPSGDVTVSLWSDRGALLSRAAGSGSGAAGWQEVALPAPITVEAGARVVASYHAAGGQFSYAYRGLDRALASGPLSVTRGLYRYASAPVFPDLTYDASQYFVDVRFARAPAAAASDPRVTLYGAITPAAETHADPTPVEVGVKVRPTTAGTIALVRFWRGAAATAPFTASLWRENGTLLARATAAPAAGGFGWQEVRFDAPVAVQAGATYVASYHASEGRFSYTLGGFSSPMTSGALAAPAGAGVYAYGASPTFPRASFLDASYWVDVQLEPAQAVFDLFGTAAPDASTSGDTSPVELGVKVRSSVPAAIRAVRFWREVPDPAGYTVSLWSMSGERLATATGMGTGARGWQRIAFATPVPVEAGVLYVASYFAANGRFSYAFGGLDAPLASGPLTAPAWQDVGGNGVFAFGAPGGFPTRGYPGLHYFVDVELVP